ncbi:HAD-IA family hydrolase [Corynebacterium sp. CCUG 65737]|uniref:HAD-IA family hydrolase n=1 Tax=Corynebacterium sp. CCUG 65737 TaxID=2823889 RepID=UPI00210E2CE9|nr:HAD-IA family hydrolase [Corynebacterium sp. CCUG 65737]MCQ4628291.1 HAD-IA family hydrolase [Corynebacterium sp. CCUG 65737]
MTTLLLDVDGTLIDSFPGIRDGFLHALDTVGVDHPSNDFIARIPGPPMEETLRSLGLSSAQLHEAFDAYMSFTRAGGWERATVFDGIGDLLAGWRADGFRLVTATSKGEGFARAILEREGLLDYFDFLGAAQENGPRRAKADVIAHVLDKVSIPSGTGLMIGDRAHDIEGAATFGIPTAAVAWGYGTSSEWEQADFLAHTPAELDTIVRNFHDAH